MPDRPNERGPHAPETRPLFHDFLLSIPKEDAKAFVMSLKESDIADMVSSVEEFRMVTGRDPFVPFEGKPEKQAQVRTPKFPIQKIEKMFEEFKRLFPGNLREAPRPPKIRIQMEIGGDEITPGAETTS